MYFKEPQEEKLTTWLNPLQQEQVVDVVNGSDKHFTRYRIAPGKTEKIPSRHDAAIHTVHNGIIIGGLAPQLVKVGSDETLDPALDTELQKRNKATAEAARAAFDKAAAEDRLLVSIAEIGESKAQEAKVQETFAAASAASEPPADVHPVEAAAAAVSKRAKPA